MTFNQKECLSDALEKNHWQVSSDIQEKFIRYLENMREWNRVFNLTSITDPRDMIILHILDSLSVSPFLSGSRIIDVGTGAGLPGIPLALMHPDKHFVLLDANHKKTRFLTQMVMELKLTNVEIITDRAENFHPKELFHCILTRAFSSLPVMLENAGHLLAEQGQFLSMKGVYPENELTEIKKPFKVSAVHRLKINGLEAERHLICMEKIQ